MASSVSSPDETICFPSGPRGAHTVDFLLPIKRFPQKNLGGAQESAQFNRNEYKGSHDEPSPERTMSIHNSFFCCRWEQLWGSVNSPRRCRGLKIRVTLVGTQRYARRQRCGFSSSRKFRSKTLAARFVPGRMEQGNKQTLHEIRIELIHGADPKKHFRTFRFRRCSGLSRGH